MSQPSFLWWQKYGTVGQIAQAAVALLGFIAILMQINVLGKNSGATRQWIDSEMRRLGVSAPDCKARKT